MKIFRKIKGAWLLAAGGVILILVGLSALAYPLMTYLRLVRYSGFALIINSVLLIIFSVTPAAATESMWLKVESALDLLFALILLFNPFMTFITYPILIGLWIFALGILKFLAGLFFRKKIKGWSAISLAGFLFISFGIVLIRGPYGSAVNTTVIIGLFGLIMGSLYLLDAIRFRNLESTSDLLL
jgi:uncharacterized membrane protein HdeD (DUF308 family)